MSKQRFASTLVGSCLLVTAVTACLRVVKSTPPPRQCPLPALAGVGFHAGQSVAGEPRCGRALGEQSSAVTPP